MRVLCKNAYLGNNTRLWQLTQELQDIQWDIVCFSESRAPDDDIILAGGHRLITNLQEDTHAGVGILIHARWSAYIVNIGRISGRLMFIDMKIGTHRLRYIAIYVPHSGYTVADFYKCLDSLKIVIADGSRILKLLSQLACFLFVRHLRVFIRAVYRYSIHLCIFVYIYFVYRDANGSSSIPAEDSGF